MFGYVTVSYTHLDVYKRQTSGGSEMGRTNAELEGSCKGAILKEGKRFCSQAIDIELKAWAEQF